MTVATYVPRTIFVNGINPFLAAAADSRTGLVGQEVQITPATKAVQRKVRTFRAGSNQDKIRQFILANNNRITSAQASTVLQVNLVRAKRTLYAMRKAGQLIYARETQTCSLTPDALRRNAEIH